MPFTILWIHLRRIKWHLHRLLNITTVEDGSNVIMDYILVFCVTAVTSYSLYYTTLQQTSVQVNLPKHRICQSLSYGLDIWGITIWLPVEQDIETGSGAHTASYSMGTNCSFSSVKMLRYEADHWPPGITKVQNKWNCISCPICLHIAHKDNLSITISPSRQMLE